jgi:hypothetical protein
MKKVMYGTKTLLLLSVFVISCSKNEKFLNKDEISGSTTLSNEKVLEKNLISSEIKLVDLTDNDGAPITDRVHRATTKRKRDGKNCGCNECAGICGDLELDGAILDVLLDHWQPRNGGGNEGNTPFEDFISYDETSKSANIYISKIDNKWAELFILKNYEHINQDADFGVDSFIEGTKTTGSITRLGNNNNTIKILPGNYNLEKEKGVIKISDNEFIPFYARVVVKANFLKK